MISVPKPLAQKERDMFGGSVKWLEERVNSLEKTIERHMAECADLGRQNRESILELIKLSNDNASACISTANKVRDDMQKAFLKYMAGAVVILIGAIEAMARLHV